MGTVKTPCLQCFDFVENHEGNKCPGRPKSLQERAEREIRRRAPALWEAKEILARLFPGLRDKDDK